MKAHLIISEEYKHNSPSVFIFAEGKYYGCLIYPSLRDYPQNVNYWRKATSSDADRFFSVEEVEYKGNDFELIKSLQNEVSELIKCLKPDNQNPWLPMPSASKKSAEFKAYVAKKEAQESLQRDTWEYNAPFEKVISEKRRELRRVILSAQRNEN